jgi:hypothetical protein
MILEEGGEEKVERRERRPEGRESRGHKTREAVEVGVSSAEGSEGFF